MAREMSCRQCGDQFSADDDDALFDVAKEHFHQEHRFLPATDEKIRAAVSENAHDV